ncbi:AcrR family transcriptional regulator [Marmoricola sp. URHA0025 HA25]
MPRAKATPANSSESEPNGRRSKRRELLEIEIYEKAAELFAERGYAGTTPQDIAEAVGISRQALYYYVSSKEEILANVVSEFAVQNVTDMKTIAVEESDPRTAIRRLALHLVAERAANGRRFRLLDRSESALPPALAKDYLAGRREALNVVIDVIDRGIKAGLFSAADVRVAALAIIGMCNWVAWWFEPGPDRSSAPVAEQIADAALAILTPPAEPTEPLTTAHALDVIERQVERLRHLT